MSCEELQLFGFDNNTFLVQLDNETQLQHCGIAGETSIQKMNKDKIQISFIYLDME